MLGVIIGDTVGSVYEWHPIKTKDFPFFNDNGFFTDDSVCTVAVAEILLHDLPPAETLQKGKQKTAISPRHRTCLRLYTRCISL